MPIQQADGQSSRYAIILTGATGYIGGHWLQRLIHNDIPVCALARSQDKADDLKASFPLKDEDDHLRVVSLSDDPARIVEDLKSFRNAHQDREVICVHLAALYIAEHTLSDAENLIQSNVGLTGMIADLCHNAKIKHLIHIGTAWEVDNQGDKSTPNLYVATKNAAREILQFYNNKDELQVRCLRLFDTYGGADTRQKLLPTLKKAYFSGETASLRSPDAVMDIVNIEDVMDALEAVCTTSWTPDTSAEQLETYYVSSGRLVSLFEIVQTINSVMGNELNVNWGRHPSRKLGAIRLYRDGPTPPGWSPKIELGAGIKRYFEK